MTDDLAQRLLDACVGRPAKIPWPHRILHEAAEAIKHLRLELTEARKLNEVAGTQIKLMTAGLAEARAREGRLQDAHLRIAFQENVSSLSGDPTKWPCTISYLALGGRLEQGKRLDSREALTAPAPDFDPAKEGFQDYLARINEPIPTSEAERRVVDAAYAKVQAKSAQQHDVADDNMRLAIDALAAHQQGEPG